MEIIDEKAVDELTYLKHKSIYVFLGVTLPVVCAVLNYILLEGRAINVDVIGMVGSKFLLPRVGYWYVIIASGALAMLLWIRFFRWRKQKWCGFIAGVLLCNAVLDLLFNAAMAYRFLGIPVWLIPLASVVVMFLAGVRALRIADTVMKRSWVIVTCMAGMLFVPIVSLVIVPQPWGLMKHLPDAQGANLRGMNLSRIYLEGFSGLTFEAADMRQVNLSHACIVHGGTNMQKVNLEGADLSYAVLDSVNLNEAYLQGANLDHAKIYMVNFTGADLRNASFGAFVLGRTDMNGANLCGADFSKTENITAFDRYDWAEATYDTTTLWPVGFDPNEYGATAIGKDENGREIFMFMPQEDGE